MKIQIKYYTLDKNERIKILEEKELEVDVEETCLYVMDLIIEKKDEEYLKVPVGLTRQPMHILSQLAGMPPEVLQIENKSYIMVGGMFKVQDYELLFSVRYENKNVNDVDKKTGCEALKLFVEEYGLK